MVWPAWLTAETRAPGTGAAVAPSVIVPLMVPALVRSKLRVTVVPVDIAVDVARERGQDCAVHRMLS